MDTSIQPDTHRIRAVTVRANPHNPGLLSLTIIEGDESSSGHVTLTADTWQRVADELASAGVVPGGHGTTILTWPTSEATS